MKVFSPRNELRPYVRYYWTLSAVEPISVLTFPIGCPMMIFHRRQPLYIHETDFSQAPFTISGQVNFPARIESSEPVEMLVAVFYPHTAGMFTDTPPSAFYNREINGFDIAGRRLADVALRISDSRGLGESVGLLERWLLTKINPTLNIRRIGGSVSTLLRAPSTPVDSLADNACLSRRQYDRIFREHVGMNPKEYARVVRFQKVLWLMQAGRRDYAGMAAECGYADQSHMIREFRRFSGHSPKQLLECQVPYSDLFTHPQLSEY